MAIPKTIYQTFKNDKLPFLTKLHIKNLRRRNPEYDYQFYNDERISDFIQHEFEPDVYQVYKSITIGAAKADFFRYAILYKKGGVYLDIDSLNVTKLDNFILPTDTAVIAFENNLEYFVQWALIFDAGHPFLKKTLDTVLENLKENKYPNDVHKMTGPAAYSTAIKECMHHSPNINFRQLGVDYDGKFKFHYRFSKFFLYGLFRKNHWRNEQTKKSI
jgi:inositol phosphorylceramide mannosyltransferase catalytic subunit